MSRNSLNKKIYLIAGVSMRRPTPDMLSFVHIQNKDFHMCEKIPRSPLTVDLMELGGLQLEHFKPIESVEPDEI